MFYFCKKNIFLAFELVRFTLKSLYGPAKLASNKKDTKM